MYCAVCDNGFATDEGCAYVTVYDSNGGFVTGGGWFYSLAGSLVDDDSAEGRANFGFNSKYAGGADAPTGQTNFEFMAGSFHFHSELYEWLVVAGHDKAKFEGIGTVNGRGSYGFMVSVKDIAEPGAGSDTFRIKIWDRAAGDGLVYDNKQGASDDGYDGTIIEGGNIQIHVQRGQDQDQSQGQGQGQGQGKGQAKVRGGK